MSRPIRYEDGQLVETEPDEYGQFDVLANIQPRSEGDAHRLVAAWNAHGDLYAACEAVRRWIEDDTFVDPDELSDDARAILATAKAAAAKARGEDARA